MTKNPAPSRMKRTLFKDAAPFKIDGVYCKLIPLTKGQFAIVDFEDYERLSNRNWHAAFCRHTKTYYAWGYFTNDGTHFHHITMHREVLGLRDSAHILADHINNVTLDNRRKNLREATHSQNCQNRRRHRDNISGFKGVSRDSKTTWRAEIEMNGERTGRCGFKSPQAAHEWYQQTATRLFGKFARFE